MHRYIISLKGYDIMLMTDAEFRVYKPELKKIYKKELTYRKEKIDAPMPKNWIALCNWRLMQRI